MAVRVPADRRFRRARVKPARRRHFWASAAWRTACGVAVLAALAYGAERAYTLATGASALRVTRITVYGNDRLSTGEMLATLSGLRGENILRADLTAWRRRILQSPWVADATLRRTLPSTIEVAIVERRPVGIGRLGGRLFLVDPAGVIIDEYGPQHSDLDLPIIDGLATAPDSGPMVDEGRARVAARLLESVARTRTLGRRISQVDVHDIHDAVVILDGDPSLIHLGEDRFAERLQAYLDLAPALRARIPDIDYVDLRFDERVYVRPTGGGHRPRKAPAPQGPERRSF